MYFNSNGTSHPPPPPCKSKVEGEVVGSRPNRSSALNYSLLFLFLANSLDVSYLDSKSKGSNKGSSHLPQYEKGQFLLPPHKQWMKIQALKKLVFSQKPISKNCTISIAIRKLDKLSLHKTREGYKANKHQVDNYFLSCL